MGDTKSIRGHLPITPASCERVMTCECIYASSAQLYGSSIPKYYRTSVYPREWELMHVSGLWCSLTVSLTCFACGEHRFGLADAECSTSQPPDASLNRISKDALCDFILSFACSRRSHPILYSSISLFCTPIIGTCAFLPMFIRSLTRS